MTNTIKELWFGNLKPIGNFSSDNMEIKQLENLMERHIEKLNKILNAEAKEIFGKYFDCVNEYDLEIGAQAFCDGFSLGAKITAEAFINAEKTI